MKARVVAATLGAALALAVLPAASAGATDRALLAQVRQATVQFHDLQAASMPATSSSCRASTTVSRRGWASTSRCCRSTTGSPMRCTRRCWSTSRTTGGTSWWRWSTSFRRIMWTSDEPPMLFGEHFHTNDVLGIWALHAWIWRGNPGGVHDDFSPNVRMCPTAN